MSKRYIIVRVLVLLAIVVVAAWFVYKFIPIGKLNLSSVQDYINSYGPFAAIVYILFFSIRTLLVIFPYSVVVILGGSIFGPVKGFIYSMVSVFISASLAFFISRLFGKEFVQKLARGKVQQFDTKIGQHGFKIILFMRLSTVFPFDIVNYTAGLTRVKYKDFILGTLLGVLPETFSLTYLGENLKNPFSWEFLLAALLVILTIAVPFAYNTFKKKVRGNR